MADAKHMCVDSNGSFAESNTHHNVRSLPADSWQTSEVFESGWDFASEIVLKHLSHTDEVLCFAVRVADAVYEFIDLFESSSS